MSITTPLPESEELAANRRNARRLRVGCAAVVWLAPAFADAGRFATDGDTELRVVRIDSLSLCGLSFVSRDAYPIGAEIWARVRLGSKTCQFKGVVRRVSVVVHAGRKKTVCGVQFLRSQQTALAVAVFSSFSDAGSGVGR